MNGGCPARFFYAEYETFVFVFHFAYLVGMRDPHAMRGYV